MTKKKEVKFNPAGNKDSITIKSTYVSANKDRSELKGTEGIEFSNELLRKSQGFQYDNNGTMSIKASNLDYMRLYEEENKIGRIVGGKEISTANVNKGKMERLVEIGKEQAKETANKNSKKDEVDDEITI